MPQSGQLVLFSATELPSPGDALLRIIRLTGAERTWYAHRTIGEDRSWDLFQQWVREEIEDDEMPEERLESDLAPEQAARAFRPGTCVTLAIARCPLASVLNESIRASIPEAIRGDFVPTDPTIRMGYHDLFEWSECDDGHLFARAFVSLSLFGYSTPNDWAAFRSLIADVPAVADLREQLAAIVGPVEHAVYWCV